MKTPDYEFDVYTATFEKLNSYLEQLAGAAPMLVRKSEIGKSREGRSLILMTVTDFSVGREQDKPALLIFANIHSHELSGPIACIRTIRGLIEDQPELLKRRTFYIIPRINPDGAEKVMAMSHYIRSRWDYHHRLNTFHQADVNGDGISLLMRQKCDWGNWVIDPKDPDHMILRTAQDKGPFYRLLNEGEFENWDGECVDDSDFDGVDRDWNRNFPQGWDSTKAYCGEFPCNEPETHALAQFITSHKNLFGNINYHNGFGSVLTPNVIEDADEKTYHRILERASRLTGYTLYQAPDSMRFQRSPMGGPKKNGYTNDFTYLSCGLYTLTIELGTAEDSAGVSIRDVLGHDYEDEYDAYPALKKWQAAHPLERKVVYDWKPFHHPQFGDVEIGGMCTISLASPGSELLKKVCDGCYQFSLEFAAKGPEMKVADVKTDAVAEDVYRVRLLLQNCGELPTNVSSVGLRSAWREKPYYELNVAEGVKCLSLKKNQELEHFGPWQTRLMEWFFKVPGSSRKLADLKVEGGAGGNFVYPLMLK